MSALSKVVSEMHEQMGRLISRGEIPFELVVDQKTWDAMKPEFEAKCIYPAELVGVRLLGCVILIDPSDHQRCEVRGR